MSFALCTRGAAQNVAHWCWAPRRVVGAYALRSASPPRLPNVLTRGHEAGRLRRLPGLHCGVGAECKRVTYRIGLKYIQLRKVACVLLHCLPLHCLPFCLVVESQLVSPCMCGHACSCTVQAQSLANAIRRHSMARSLALWCSKTQSSTICRAGLFSQGPCATSPRPLQALGKVLSSNCCMSILHLWRTDNSCLGCC